MEGTGRMFYKPLPQNIASHAIISLMSFLFTVIILGLLYLLVFRKLKYSRKVSHTKKSRKHKTISSVSQINLISTET